MASPATYYMLFHIDSSGGAIQCAEPDTPPPFRVEELWLKQTDPSELNETGRLILRAFGAFFERLKATEASFAAERESALSAWMPSLANLQYMSEPGPNRRFAGDWELPRTRYYSLCHSETGDDGGTMERELLEYHEPATHGWLDINDITEATTSNAIYTDVGAGDYRRARSGYLVSIPPLTLAKLFPELIKPDSKYAPLYILLPTKVQRRAFQRVIDLRIPSVAAWFTRNLTRIEWTTRGSRAFMAKGPLEEFDRLLPSLFVQTHGGGEGATRIAGQWLRALGAEALIFPSARSDAFVEATDDAVVRWGGWNLVDYTNAPPIRTLSFDMTPTWISHLALEVNGPPTPLYRDIHFDTVRSGPHAGSWALKNLQAYRAAFRMSQQALYVYSSARALSPKQQSLLLQLILQDGSSASIMKNSSAILRALIGDLRLRHLIRNHITQNAPEVARELELELVFSDIDKLVACIRGMFSS